MASSVYIETTIISYLTSRRSSDAIIRGQQELTVKWWSDHRSEFSLVTSQFVVDEASVGDARAAADRMAVLDEIDSLAITPAVEPLALRLIDEGALPAKAKVDALHLAISTVNGVQYLLTWNCKHLANAILWRKIEQTCRDAGYVPPNICTPYELMETPP